MACLLPDPTPKQQKMETKTFEVIPSQSGIAWTGRKVTGAHNGTIGVTAGMFMVENGKLIGGKFIIDTTSIKILDVTDTATNAQFAAHLASDDFFASNAFPTAIFEITSVTPAPSNFYHIGGNLTIKGITAPVSFDAMVEIHDSMARAVGKITIDRTKYDMKFRSGSFFKNLGDTLIYNDFDLNINISAKAVDTAGAEVSEMQGITAEK
jgi:hypothetical protein